MAMLSTPSVACSLVLGAVLSLPAPPAHAQAGNFPSRQLQIIVPFPAGGSADFFARSVFNKLAPAIGHPVVIENKAGASGIIGAKTVINAAPDGHTATCFVGGLGRSFRRA